MAETNAQRKKRQVIPNQVPEQPLEPSLPPSVVVGRPSVEVPRAQVTAPPQRAPVVIPTDPLDELPGRAEDFDQPEATTFGAEFGRGLQSGFETLSGLRRGFQGAVLGAVGEEEAALQELEASELQQRRAGQVAPSIQRVEDIQLGAPGGFDRAKSFVAGILGKQSVIFAPTLTAGAVGAVAAPVVGAPALAGSLIAGVGTGSALEAGDAFTNIAGDPESVENLGVTGVSRLALGTGLVSGVPEAIPAVAAVKRVGLLRPFQRAVRDSLARRVAKGTLSQSAVEGLTEGAQTIIQRSAAKFANENREILGEEGYSELLNSIVSGAIFGAPIGGITGIPSGGRAPERGTVEDQIDLEDSLDDLDRVGGRSEDLEASIDESEFGDDLRAARARPDDSRVFDTPDDVISEITSSSLQEQITSRQREQLLKSARELADAERQDELPRILLDAGVPLEQVDDVAAAIFDQAEVEGIETLHDLLADELAQNPTKLGQEKQAAERPELGDVSQQLAEEDDKGIDQFASGFEETWITRRHIFRNANGKLGWVPSSDPNRPGSLERAVASMEPDFPDIEFSTIPLGEAVVAELDKNIRNDPEALDEVLNDIAFQKLNEPGFKPETVAELDPSNPLAFLNQFRAIRKETTGNIFAGADPLRLTDSDIRGGVKQGFVTVAEPGERLLVSEELEQLQSELSDVTAKRKKREGKIKRGADEIQKKRQALQNKNLSSERKLALRAALKENEREHEQLKLKTTVEDFNDSRVEGSLRELIRKEKKGLEREELSGAKNLQKLQKRADAINKKIATLEKKKDRGVDDIQQLLELREELETVTARRTTAGRKAEVGPIPPKKKKLGKRIVSEGSADTEPFLFPVTSTRKKPVKLTGEFLEERRALLQQRVDEFRGQADALANQAEFLAALEDKSPSHFRAVAEVRKMQAAAESRFKNASERLRELDEKGIERGEVEVAEAADAVTLTNMMLTKIGREDTRSLDLIANAFYSGMAALQQRGFKIEFDLLPNDLVIHKLRDFQVRLGEIKKTGAGRIRERMRNRKEEERDILAQIKSETQKLAAGVGKDQAAFIRRKIKRLERRVKKIPDETRTLMVFARSVMRDVDAVAEAFSDEAAMLDAEAADLDHYSQMAADVQEIVTAFEREGLSTVNVEQLGKAASRMENLLARAEKDRDELAVRTAAEGTPKQIFHREADELTTREKIALREALKSEEALETMASASRTKTGEPGRLERQFEIGEEIADIVLMEIQAFERTNGVQLSLPGRDFLKPRGGFTPVKFARSERTAAEFELLLSQLRKEEVPTFVVTETGGLQAELPEVRADMIKEIRRQASLLRAKAFGKGAIALNKLKDLQAKKDAELVDILQELEQQNLTRDGFDDSRIDEMVDDIADSVSDMRARAPEDTGTDMPRAINKKLKEIPKVVKEGREAAEAFLRDLDLSDMVLFLNGFAEVKDYLLKTDRKYLWDRFTKGELFGRRIWDTQLQKHVVVINPLITNRALELETIGHEIGHVVQTERFDKETDEVKAAVLTEYNLWREKVGKATPARLARITKSPYNTVMAMLSMDSSDSRFSRTIFQLSKSDQEYIYSFREWWADQVSRWFTQDLIPDQAGEVVIGKVPRKTSKGKTSKKTTRKKAGKKRTTKKRTTKKKVVADKDAPKRAPKRTPSFHPDDRRATKQTNQKTNQEPPKKTNRVIIAGSRTFNNIFMMEDKLNGIFANLDMADTEIISGVAEGADKTGEKWAGQNGVQVRRFPADWKKLGRKAGFIRNQQMADEATHLVAFWDGKSSGTKHMIRIAKEKGLKVRVVNVGEGVSQPANPEAARDTVINELVDEAQKLLNTKSLDVTKRRKKVVQNEKLSSQQRKEKREELDREQALAEREFEKAFDKAFEDNPVSKFKDPDTREAFTPADEQVVRDRVDLPEELADFDDSRTDDGSADTATKGLVDAFTKRLSGELQKIYTTLIEEFGFAPAESVAAYMDNLMNKQGAKDVEVAGRTFSEKLERLGLDSDSGGIAGILQTLDPWGHQTGQFLRDAFKLVLTEEERKTLYSFFSRASMRRRLKELAATPEQKELIESSPLHAAVFGYQMWIAGELPMKGEVQQIVDAEIERVESELGVTERGPATAFVVRLFQNMFDFLAAKLGFVTEGKQAEQILKAVRDGWIDQRAAGQKRWSVTTSVRENVLQRIAQRLNDAYTHMKPVYDKALGIAQARMLDSGIPAFERIANGFFAAVGTEDVPESFFEARRTMIGDFMNQYTELTRQLQQDDDLKSDVLHNMRNPRSSRDPEVQEISQQLFKFLRQFRNYLTEAGVEIGDRGKEYFPWVWDPRQMQDNSDFVRGLLEDPRYEKDLTDWLERENAKLRRITKGKYQITKEELVDKIMAGLMQTEGYVDHSLDPDVAGTTPWFGAMHFRSLHFIPDKLSAAELETWDSLFSGQLDLIMMTYIRQGVKRAEYARRFGDKSQKLEEMLQDAKQEGASQAEMEMAYNYIDAMTGVIGESTNNRVRKTLGLEKRNGEIINPTFATFSSVAMVLQNLAVLPLATLTSLVDPVGILVRSQDLNATMASLRQGAREMVNGIKNIAKADKDKIKSELNGLAQSMGTIEDHLTNEALEWEYGSTYLTPRWKATNEFFFKAIGLTQWTRMTRVMALAGGREFIKRHIQRPNKNSERFLRQLGLRTKDVLFDDAGDVVILTRTERNELLKAHGETGGEGFKAELDRDSRVRNALNRFVDEAILRPNAAQRPIWGSDPHWALVFHLKSFMFSFHDRILRRTWTEGLAGNFVPMMLLAAFVPAMLFADILRDLIRFGLDGNPRKAHWDLGDHIWSATQRSGLNGIGQLLIDAKQDVQFGGVGYESLAGPTADGVADLSGLFSEDDEAQWRAFTRNLPGNSAWRHWFDNGFEGDNEQPLTSFQN